jgi:hypothetical protein
MLNTDFRHSHMYIFIKIRLFRASTGFAIQPTIFFFLSVNFYDVLMPQKKKDFTGFNSCFSDTIIVKQE